MPAEIDPVKDYQDALLAVRNAEAHIKDIVDLVTKVANLFGHWQNLMSNPQGELLLPTPDRKSNVSLRKWPSAEDITKALGAWRKAKDRADDLWKSLPPERRTALRSPTEFLAQDPPS